MNYKEYILGDKHTISYEYLWDLLSNEWFIDLSNQTKTISINEIDDEIKKILKGGQIGRVVIKHGD